MGLHVFFIGRMLLVAFDYLLQVDGFFGDKIVSAVFAIAYQTMSAVAFVARVGMYRESYFSPDSRFTISSRDSQAR